MEAHRDRKSAFDPSMGVLIPSPVISHTHAVASHPFDPNALFTSKDNIKYLPEHAIASFPLEHQAFYLAGQAIVIREMAKLKWSERRQRCIQHMQEVDLHVHQNPKARHIEDYKFWRETLGWAGSRDGNAHEQKSRYSTCLPGKSRLLRCVYDKYIWDHEHGIWKQTSHSGVHETAERREWVCKELERIDELRYDIMAKWKKNTHDAYMASSKKKRKRDDEPSSPESATVHVQQQYDTFEANAAMSDSKRLKSVSFDDNTDISIECASKRPRSSIEPQFEFPLPKAPGSQKTKSSFSEAFSTSPDADYEIRSQAPEPESPVKQSFLHENETTSDFIKRYSFVLDIPTTDGQRVEWIRFLEKYHWNPSMISALRRFFMADVTPNTTQTKAYLNKLKDVCATIVAVKKSPEGEQKYRLLWDAKASVNVAEAAAEVAKSSTSAKLPQQPTSITSARVSPISITENRTPETLAPSNLTISPTESQVREAEAAENIQAAMKGYVTTLTKGDRVEPPCDRCREFGLECRINKTSCKTCADSHNRCQWTEVEAKELKVIMERGPKSGLKSSRKMGSGRRSGKGGARKSVATLDRSGVLRRVWTSRRSMYDLLGDGDETGDFLEGSDKDSIITVGNTAIDFADIDDEVNSGDEDEDEDQDEDEDEDEDQHEDQDEDEWVPSP